MRTKRLIYLAASLPVLTAAVWRELPNRFDSFGPQAVTAQDGEKTRLRGLPAQYRDTVAKALAYLAKQQHKDGHWEGENGTQPVATTALAGLALFMEQDDGKCGKHWAYADKAADWLMEQSRPERDGLIYSGHESETARYMEGHGLATMFLGGLHQNERGRQRDETDRARGKKLSAVLTRAVGYIAKAQSSQGGWYHTSRAEGHDFDAVLPTVIQLQALRAAEDAGIPVSRETMSDGHEYLKSAIAKNTKGEATPDTTTELAAIIACHIGWESDEGCELWLARCRAKLPMGKDAKFGRDDLGHFYYAQAAHFLDQQRDEKKNLLAPYRTAMFEHLQSTQNKDGSWPGGGDAKTGSVQTTALWCVVLQIGRSRHPAQRPRNVVLF